MDFLIVSTVYFKGGISWPIAVSVSTILELCDQKQRILEIVILAGAAHEHHVEPNLVQS